MLPSLEITERLDILPKSRAKDQQQSPLLRLPFEIRTMILKLLLIHDGPLKARKLRGAKAANETNVQSIYPDSLRRHMDELARPSYDLYPSILATCQIMCKEGLPLLYDANTIGLQFYGGRVILYAAAIWFDPGAPNPVPIKPTNEQMNKLVSRFDNMHIDVLCSLHEGEYLTDLMFSMADFLLGKCIQVEFIDPGDLIYGDGHYDEPSAMEDLLCIFKLARCVSFEVLNTTLDPSRVFDVIETVTSDQPIVNLWPSLEDFGAYLLAMSNICVYGGTTELFTSVGANYNWLEMLDGALQCDVARFREARDIWMREIRNNFEEGCRIAFRNDELHRSI